MTDTEQKEICRIAHINDISDLSDGYHTFRQLYYQRMMLFATIVKQNRDKAWKSLRHSDGELCFGGGWFIVGIDTPKGSYTYHYEDNYFSLFDCIELECGKHWDGHTEKDITRLLSLEQEPCDDCISRKDLLKIYEDRFLELQKIKRLKENKGAEDRQMGVNYCINILKEMPSVTPQPKMGRWINIDATHSKCDRCGAVFEIASENGEANYCPNCGQPKMQDVEE